MLATSCVHVRGRLEAANVETVLASWQLFPPVTSFLRKTGIPADAIGRLSPGLGT